MAPDRPGCRLAEHVPLTRRVTQHIAAICRWAVAQGYRSDDPAGLVVDVGLPRNAAHRRPMPALPYEEVAECIAKVKASRRASATPKLALEALGSGGGVIGDTRRRLPRR